LKYLNFGTICDVAFGFFMLTWAVVRHGLYLLICWSVYNDIPAIIPYGCYRGRNGFITGPFPAPDRFAHLFQPFRDPEGVVCWNDGIKWGFLSALLFLQAIMVMWFTMIVRVALTVLKGGEAHEPRSDDDGDDVEDERADEEALSAIEALNLAALAAQKPFEEEVGVEAINLKGRTSNMSRYRKSSSSASGVSLPGHSDRKELLGRIGCDKGT
jgi:acyl-CoA-dependent ceramide synthase